MKLIINSIEHLDSGDALVHYTITKDEKYFHNEGSMVICEQDSVAHIDDVSKIVARKIIEGLEESLS